MDKIGLVGNHQAACTGWAKGTSAVAAVAAAVVAETVGVVAEAAVAEATVPVVVAVAVTPTLFEGETFVARVGIPAVGKAGPAEPAHHTGSFDLFGKTEPSGPAAVELSLLFDNTDMMDLIGKTAKAGSAGLAEQIDFVDLSGGTAATDTRAARALQANKIDIVGNHQAACTDWAKDTSAVAAVAVAAAVVAETLVVAEAVTSIIFVTPSVARVGIPAVGKADLEAEAPDPSLEMQ
jgi:hypothetical protein